MPTSEMEFGVLKMQVKKYFGVSASQLTLDEAATLAGMLKGPELYNPLNSIEDSTNRRDTVSTKHGRCWLY